MSTPENRPDGFDPEKVAEGIRQLELLVAKYRHAPENDPASWRGVGRRVNAQLRSICVRPLAVVDKALKVVESCVGSVGEFLEGVGGLPGNFGKLIGGRRAGAKALEDQRQAAAESEMELPATPVVGGALPAPDSAPVLALPPPVQLLPAGNGTAASQIRDLLASFEARGLFAKAFHVEGYGILIVICRPDAVLESLEEGLRLLRDYRAVPPAQRRLAEPHVEDGEYEGLNGRWAAALVTAGITVDRLRGISDADLLKIKGVGPKGAKAIRAWLARDGTGWPAQSGLFDPAHPHPTGSSADPATPAVSRPAGEPDTPHDVFISFSSKDGEIAQAVCRALESAGVRCWISSRDIRAAASWTTSIVNAIAASRMVILIFSGNAQRSEYIKRELGRAADYRVPIAVVRIEDVAPDDDLKFLLSTSHWLNAVTPPLDQHLQRLATDVRRHLDAGRAETGRP